MNDNLPSRRDNKRPLISVIMSIYSEPLEWLRLSIDSILKQTYDLFEFIIVCDNPNYEDGINLLKEYSERDSRIRIVYNPNNIGLTKSLNKALSVAKGQLIARMDADDIAFPERFEMQVRCLEGKNKSLCHSGKIIINDKGEDIRVDVVKHEIDYSQLFLGNMIAHPSVMMTSDVLGLRTLLYNENVKRGQDYELWTYFFLNGVNFIYIAQPLMKYRVSEEQISQKHVAEQWRNSQAIRNQFVVAFLKQCGLTINYQNLKGTRELILKCIKSKNSSIQKAFKKIVFLIDYNLVTANCLNIVYFIIDKSLFYDIDSIYKKMFWQAATRKKIYPFWILKQNE